MNRPSSTEPPDLWERDGSLRDVYVLGTSETDWASLLEVARNHHATYSYGGAKLPLPQPGALFSNRDRSHLLQIDLGGVLINCHFFVPEEIELDIDPRQVVDESCHEMVLAFLEELAQKIRKPLALTLENAPQLQCLSFDPTTNRWTVHALPGDAT
jgi:hypothetical protein